MSWLFESGGQSTKSSALASVLLMNVQDSRGGVWFRVSTAEGGVCQQHGPTLQDVASLPGHTLSVSHVHLLTTLFLPLCWVFIAAPGLSLIAVDRDYSSLWCSGFSLWWLLLLQSTGSRAQAQ